MGVRESDPRTHLCLPPGFRFYPTDEELLVQYLCRKVAGYNFSLPIIGEIDLYKFDPWDLPNKALFGEKEWYFFSPRDRKYPNGSRPNRMAGSGYWKATGTDKIITTEGRKVGIKKALVFYVGKAPKGTKTNWIMHEYRLSETPRKNGSTRLDDWVLCRIYKKNSSGQKPAVDGAGAGRSNEHSHGTSSSCSSQYDDVLDSLPEINDRFFSLPRMGSLKSFDLLEDQKVNLQQLGSGNYLDWNSMAGIGPLCPDIVQAQDMQVPFPGANMTIHGFRDDGVAPATTTTAVLDEEVQSGQGSRRSDRFAPSMSGSVQNFYGSADPFGLHFLGQQSGFGFRQ